MSEPIEPLRKADLNELHEWAERVREEANGWAARAEKSRSGIKQLTTHIDVIAAKAVHVANITFIIKERK